MAPFQTTGWFMMAFVRNGTANTWNAYVDSSGSLTNVDSTQANDFGLGSVFELGRNQGASQTDRTGALYFTGGMDDVMLFNTALSTTQLNTLYTNPRLRRQPAQHRHFGHDQHHARPGRARPAPRRWPG